MLKRIMSIAATVACWIIGIYLGLAFIVIPIGATWAIKSQGTTILQKPVSARLVTFNPFLWRLSIYGFNIRDAHQDVMIGFKKLSVDVSFIALLKKQYRVESIVLDELIINAALLADGHINLMDLVPPAPKGEVAARAKPAVNEPVRIAQPLPIVMIDRISLMNGQVHFIDQSLVPNFQTRLNGITLTMTNFSTQPDQQTKIVLEAKLDDKGVISSETLMKPMKQPLEVDTTLSINSYAMQILTPYVGKYTGRALSDGKMDFKMDYRIADNKITASHKILIQKFTFGEKVASKDALSLPFGLAVALLEDPQGRINISLPVKGDMSDPKFEYMHLVGQVVKNFFVKLVTKPFAILASVIGSDSGTDELGSVRFLPGKSDVSVDEQHKLTSLVKGLKERPKLKLEINGSYDPEIDWKAIKIEVLNNDFHVLKGESTHDEEWIYKTLYQRRFGIRALWSLANAYKEKMPEFPAELRRQLIERDKVDQTALGVLAQARAKVIYDFIIAAGFDSQRLAIGNPHAIQASVGFVPLEFTLTVFENAQTSH